MTDRDRKETEESRGPEIHTQAGVSDGNMDSGEPLTGKGSEEAQEEGSDFYEEIGGLIEGKEVEDLHTPDLVDD